MATKKNEITEMESVTGLGDIPAKEYKDAEYDLVTSLLEAADFKNSEDAILKVNICRGGKFYFSVRIRPISDEEVSRCRREAGIYKANPTNKKLGKVRVDTDSSKFSSWLIYTATIEEDQQNIWNNQVIMQKFNLMQPWESIDKLLMAGEKDDLLDKVFKLSALKDEDEDETTDEETFRT